MSTHPQATEALLTVYDGQRAIGFILRRGPGGVEAFAADDTSLGLFDNDDTAAAAIWKRAHSQGAAT
jgi:hypothetical protein